MGRRTALELPPGVHEPWLGLWRAALRQLQDQGSWVPAQKGLLDEYVFALKGAAEAREEGERGFEDKCAKRAVALADALGLTAKARKAVARKQEEPDGDDALAKLYEFQTA